MDLSSRLLFFHNLVRFGGFSLSDILLDGVGGIDAKGDENYPIKTSSSFALLGVSGWME